MFGLCKKKFFDNKYVSFNEMEKFIYADNKLSETYKNEIENFLLNQLRKIDVKIRCKDANRIINLSRITDFTPEPSLNDYVF